ncbi:MAG: cytochrome c maturation protein CcmE [bacterium]|nr:cytochrome c maturation protein CcmE [bacterium]
MKRYWRFLIPAGAIVVVLIFLLVTLSGNLVYFKTPTEITEQGFDPDSRVRLGGQVEAGTVTDTTGGVSFSVTDGRIAVDVVHSGAPQDLFREGIGVVLEGNWDGSVFHSDTMLIKHDEQYRTEESEYTPPSDGASDS